MRGLVSFFSRYNQKVLRRQRRPRRVKERHSGELSELRNFTWAPSVPVIPRHRIKPSDIDYLKITGKGSFEKRCYKATHATLQWTGGASALFEMLYGLPLFYSCRKAEMFENILHAPLQVHSGGSQAAFSVLEGLLKRDISKCLDGSRDLVELQEHPFFESINWEDPPFIPKGTGPCDVSYMDPVFTLQPVPASVNERSQVGGTSEAYLGFSFVDPVEYMVAEPVS
ncbi:hypothetical protein FQN60_016970 [Etheostoma spectabile]|uniref:AGC-kinase C-terminal domain-containing protein n=1 Tax=Etheostoma spectabile TaxID=54343 RepID=A0A5J5DE66_9PERO|nr:hypothetical protein FQN60_016970 [Etheostoma spectabile]